MHFFGLMPSQFCFCAFLVLISLNVLSFLNVFSFFISVCSPSPILYVVGFDMNFMDDVGQTLLNWAAAFGTYEMVHVHVY